MRRNIRINICLFSDMVSFRIQMRLGPCPLRSVYFRVLISKFPTSIPAPFIQMYMNASPPPPPQVPHKNMDNICYPLDKSISAGKHILACFENSYPLDIGQQLTWRIPLMKAYIYLPYK